MTTHEIRNPLAAIQLCADGIVDSIAEAQTQPEFDFVNLLENNLDSARTIVLCAQQYFPLSFLSRYLQRRLPGALNVRS